MCLFFFLLCEKKLHQEKKKVADAAQRSFSENQIVVDGGGKYEWGIVDEARCDSQLFCDALFIWPVLLSV